MSHAVARLRAERLARSNKPFIARGSRAVRCPDCRVIASHCLCAFKPKVTADAGMCLVMHDTEPLKPTNTGWLIADLVEDTSAFGWLRTDVDPRLLALLDDPKWQPYIVFPVSSSRQSGLSARWCASRVNARCSFCSTPPGPKPARCFARALIWTASQF